MLKKSFFSSVISRFFVSQLLVSSILMAMITGCACTDHRKPETGKRNKDQEIAALDAFASRWVPVEAIAEIKALQGNQIKGRVTFTKVPEGIKIVADIDGLSPGKHGFHIHEFGDCSGDGSGTGSHFNPTNHQHGSPDNALRHIGDLGNLIADETGHAHYERVDSMIKFEGPTSILGRSIVIHTDADDFKTQPTGASGNKIGCGVIQAVQKHNSKQMVL